jgi:hypothetical protein
MGLGLSIFKAPTRFGRVGPESLALGIAPMPLRLMGCDEHRGSCLGSILLARQARPALTSRRQRLKP